MRSSTFFVLFSLSGCAEAAPLLRITAPADDATVCGAPLRVTLEVTDFGLEEPPANPDDARPGTGHVDLALNGQDVAMVWDHTLIDDVARSEVEIQDVDDGEYQLSAELSNGDHSPVQPFVGDLIYLTVSASACGT